MSRTLNRMSDRLTAWTARGDRAIFPGAMNVVFLRTKTRDEAIARALLAMDRDPARRWTVAELAKIAGLSRASFARRFRRALGVTPLRHLTDLRMRFAAEQLTSNVDKLAAIAALVGYTSEFAFAKAFKRAFGISPGSFRNGAREATIRAAA
jgi:transcriptional regulator GlxA family with amidase domain